MQLGFHPVAVVSKTVHEYKIINYMYGEKQYTEKRKPNIEIKTYKTRKQTRNEYL